MEELEAVRLSLPVRSMTVTKLRSGIDYSSISYTTQHGFAAVGSNNGHNGTTGNAFYQNPDVVADFADRA